jgi:endonuclease III
MKKVKNKMVVAAMEYYDVLRRSDEHKDVRWTKGRKNFTLDKANAFFVWVLLNQGQKAERADEGSGHFIENQFTGRKGFWEIIATADPRVVKRICTSGYNGKSYATFYTKNKFPQWLRSAAMLMLKKYRGDPRNIWAVTHGDVGPIYDRFKEFDGIGDALAKMAQFALVRNYGMAGGKKYHSMMSVKPDVLVRRVLARTGLATSEDIDHVLTALKELKLRRPVEFDASLWVVGRSFCDKSSPDCDNCPFDNVCERKGI